MKNTLKKFRLHVQELEVKAAEKVDGAFSRITVDDKLMSQMTLKLLKDSVPEFKKAIKEGYQFGTYVKGLSKKVGNDSEGN